MHIFVLRKLKMQNYDTTATIAMAGKVLYTAFFLAVLFQPALRAQSYQAGPVLVLDPGHGGKDPGAKGKTCMEKQVTLALCLKIQDRLYDLMPDAAVYMTRQCDTFIPLHARAAMANERQADLFISIHCNALHNHTNGIRGTETYVMGLHKAEENLAVARRENEAILMEASENDHYQDLDFSGPASHIVLCHLQDQYLHESIALAKSIEQAFDRRHPGKSRGVRQAGFHVLHQVSVPGILVETGYISHPEEEKYLCSEQGQRELADMICEGILRYFKRQPAHPVMAMLEPSIKGVKPSAESSDYIYKIQLAASKDKPVPGSEWYDKPEYEVIQDGEYYRLVFGSFLTADEARKEKDRLQTRGFKDAFIIRFLGDKMMN
ncbi:MAG TPA: N-acetylmuramoyl-L-alanine amidase [Saprospiraceae bacterium]|nr:N-acetylmuramoyl-L-alanine amidase [Saprospiraceae bacterium]